MHRGTGRSLIAALISATVVLAVAGQAVGAPADTSPTLDEATARAVELEGEIDELRGEQVAIEERISVTNLRIFRQQEVLAATRDRLRSAQDAYRSRLVRIYKSGDSALTLLLSAESLSDFYARAIMLTRIVEKDRQAYQDAAVASAEAEYQAAYLDELKAQDVELRQVKRNRLRVLQEALAEQKAIVDDLTQEQLAIVAETRASISLTRQQWRDSSVPTSQTIDVRPVIVEPHIDRTYLSSVHHPERFRSTGRTMVAVCSWYGNEFNGRPTASGQVFNQDDLTCASRTLPFGTWLALTRGDRRIVVVVTDRGPFIEGRDLDLSRRAAQELGFSGVAPVDVEFVEPVGSSAS